MSDVNQLFCDLRNLQYDYADCKGNHGPVISSFTKILDRYHQNYCLWEPITEEERTPPKAKNSLLSEVIFIGVMAGLLILLAKVLENTFLTIIFYIVASFLFASRRGNPVWGVLTGALTIAFVIVGKLFSDSSLDISIIIFSVALVIYTIAAIAKFLSVGKQVIVHKSELKEIEADLRKIEFELEADRRKMNELLPQLVAEFKAKQQEIIRNSCETIDSRLLKTCSELPPIFWWQISPQELKEFEDNFTAREVDDDIAWETRWVNRSRGKEFADAGYEYSPLVEVTDTSEEYKKVYDEVKEEFFASADAGVFDFISMGISASVEKEVFKYEEYAHSDFERFSNKLLWASLGSDIDSAKRNNKITDEQYAYLSTAYVFASPGVYTNIDAKVEKTNVTYRSVNVHTNIWVGQMLLVDDDRGDGIVVVDYRSQIPHLFKNIDSLADVRITRISGDPVKRNPMVMAKFHKVCELCR